MIAIITQKQGVALAIARALDIPAQERDGYLEGGGYLIAWTGRQLLEPSLPEDDGAGYPPASPASFNPVPRKIKTAKGCRADAEAVKQLDVIRRVFSRCERVIAATDPSGDGELAFRYVYRYLECAKPFSRLWLTALTDMAIRWAVENLREGKAYDALCLAADARMLSDRLMEARAGRAMREATGGEYHYPGRLQTPLLAMVCKRYSGAGHLKSGTQWQLTLILRKGDTLLRAKASELLTDEQQVVKLYGRLRDHPVAKVEYMECKERKLQPPLPYNLATLQKEAGSKFAMSAAHTLYVAHKLYEAGLISWPETTSRRIPRDVFESIPALVEALKDYPPLEKQAVRMAALRRNTHCLDRRKTAGHHAIIPTGNRAEKLTPSQEAVYGLIAAGMLEALAPAVTGQQTSVGISCEGAGFRIERSRVSETGWAEPSGMGQDGGHGNDENLPPLEQGEILRVAGCSLVCKKVKGESHFTDASLIEAMETVAGSGIGTPGTRAALIGSLVKEGYICRQGKTIAPTRKGMELYDRIKTLRIASVEKAARWEKRMEKIESNPARYDTCMQDIYLQVERAAEEVESVCALQGEKIETPYICPRCRLGKITFYDRIAKCTYSRCNLTLSKEVCGHKLTDRQLTALFKTGRSTLIRGFKDKQGEPFEAYIFFDGIGNLHFEYAEGGL